MLRLVRDPSTHGNQDSRCPAAAPARLFDPQPALRQPPFAAARMAMVVALMVHVLPSQTTAAPADPGAESTPAAAQATGAAAELTQATAAQAAAAQATQVPATQSQATEAQATNVEAKILDRVTVHGTSDRARRTPGSVDRVSEAELEKQNQGVDDIHRVLFRVPGVNIQEEEGYGLRPNIGMRGTGSERSAGITVMEDGVLIAPAPYASPAAYYFPQVGRMHSVEVRKGSSAIKYGPRTNGGALNVISTPVPETFMLRLTGAAGSDRLKKLNASYGDSRGAASWLLETYQVDAGGFKVLDGGGDTGFQLEDYVGKFRLSTSMDSRIYQEVTLKVTHKEEDSHETYLGLTENDFEADPYRRYSASERDLMDNRHRQFQIRHFIQPGDRVDVTTTVYRNEFERNWYKLDRIRAGGVNADIADILEDPSAFAEHYRIMTGTTASADGAVSVKANNREYYAQGIESILGLDMVLGKSRHEMELGVRVHSDEEDRFQHSDGYRMETDSGDGSLILTNPGVPGATGGGDNRINSASAVAVFLQDQITIDRWTLTPGLRLESISTKVEQHGSGDSDRRGETTVTRNETDVLLPGGGVHYQLSGAVGAFLGFHRGFAPPGPDAVDSTKAEKSWNYESGVRYTEKNLKGSLVGFYSDYSNLLGRDTFASGGTGLGDLYNAGEVTVIGIEAALALDAGLRMDWPVNVPATFSYTFTQAEFQTAFSSGFEPWGEVASGDRLPYLPTHQFAATVGVERTGWGVFLLGSYQSLMRTRAGQGDIPANESTDARFIADVSGELSLSTTTRAFVSVQNVADEVYIAARRPAGLRPGLPRTFTAGLKVSL